MSACCPTPAVAGVARPARSVRRALGRSAALLRAAAACWNTVLDEADDLRTVVPQVRGYPQERNLSGPSRV